MSRPYLLINCSCEHCTVANTKAVRPPATRFIAGRLQPADVLHGTDATRYLEADRRGTERVGEIAERLRTELGLKAQRGDEPR